MSRPAPARLAALLAGACGILLVSAAHGLPPSAPKTGMVCFDGSLSGSTRTFDLVANTGDIQTPDGNSVFMWSYSTDGPAANYPSFQYPGPVLCANQGETLVVHLRNTLPDPTSIVFPGQDTAVSATGGTAGFLTTEASAAGGSVTYTFTAGAPGTYLYESGTDVAKQVEMGLYGALVVRPAGNPGHAYDEPAGYGASTAFDPKHEYLLLLAEIDPELHHAVETGGPYDFDALHNRYYTVNGRSFPDTLQDNGSGLLPTQPYGSLVRMQPTDPGDAPTLIRMIDAGVDNHPFHPHGNHLLQIAQDGRLLTHPDGASAATERFGETIGAGQTEDFLLRWDTKGFDTAGVQFDDAWDPTTNPFPIAPPNYLNVTFKDARTWYSGSPYLGYRGTLPSGTTSLNVCGEWYFPWHSHALNEFTNFDEGFGGMATLLRVDPKGGCFAYPTSTKILAGTLNGGAVSALAGDDASYYKVNSTTSGNARSSEWYGQFSSIPAGATSLAVTYKGNDLIAPVAGPTYSQTFSGLASSGTSSTLPAGWSLVETGSAADASYTANNGSSATGDTYSYGAASGGSVGDRALGSLRTSTLASTFGAAFTNTTGGTITSLAIQYRGERWRKGQSGTTHDRLDFQYSLDATDLANGTWTDVDQLDFASPAATGSAGSVNGNANNQGSTRTATIGGLAIPNGATYRIRWVDADATGADDGLAVDSFTLTPSFVTGTVQTRVSIWNWTTSSWTSLAGPTAVGATDVTVANGAAVPTGPFIGTGSNKGLVRVRVLTTGGSSSFVTGGNLMKLVYDAP